MVSENSPAGAAAPSMLIGFSGSNIRSFRDDFEVSLLATSISESRVVRNVPWRHGATRTSSIPVLPVAAFFGANASGKSNVLRAMSDMRLIVMQSFRSWADAKTHRNPFRLDAESRHKPSRYEVELVLDGVLHRYGFVLDDEAILEEWLFRFPKGRPQKVFERVRDDITYGTNTKARTVRAAELVRSNALLLSTAVAFRGSELQPLYDWFGRNLALAEASNRSGRQVFTAKQMQDPVRRKRILALLRAADLGVVDVEEVPSEALSPEFKEKMEQILRILSDGEETNVSIDDLDDLVNLVHSGPDGNRVRFKPEDESLGTVVWLGLVGPIIDALDEGSVLLADELDASLHPMLVEQIVQLFQDPVSNPKRAQLLFNSHDSHLLGDSQQRRVLGRDQVWFVEKQSHGATALFPLSDLAPRKEEAIGKRYLDGRYGGVPIVAAGDFEDAARLEPVG